MQVFEYVIFKDEKLNKDGEVTDEASMITSPKSIFAKDKDQALLLAARSIPEDQLPNIDRIQVVVRPF